MSNPTDDAPATLPAPVEPPALVLRVATLRLVMRLAAWVVAALFLVGAVKLVPLIFQNQSIDERFSMLVKVIVWLTGMFAPAAMYWQFQRRVGSADTLATISTAIGFAHTLVGCAAIGMYWSQYTLLERLLLISWTCCGAIVFVFAVRAETSKPQEPEPPPKRHVPKPDR
jgi:hypothetical protein